MSYSLSSNKVVTGNSRLTPVDDDLPVSHISTEFGSKDIHTFFESPCNSNSFVKRSSSGSRISTHSTSLVKHRH